MKTLVITGGTKGIGFAIAEKFLKQGFHVFTCGSTEKSVLELKNQNLQNLFAKKVDLTQKQEIKAWAADVLSSGSRPDILINNAGRFVPGSIGEEKDGDFEAMISTNLASAYHCTRAFLPEMKAAGNGQIFNICSTASLTAYTNGGSYGISKFGLLGLSKTLREELKPFGIKVVSVLPGATFTDSWSSSGLPTERFIQPNDIADLVWTCANLGAGTVVEELLIRPFSGDI